MENNVYQLSKAFAIRMYSLFEYLVREKREYIFSKQSARSGTSIGANIHEAKFAQSNADFISKMSIALKEASETDYWIDLIYEKKLITDVEYESLHNDCQRIIAILIKIVKKSKEKESNKSQTKE